VAKDPYKDNLGPRAVFARKVVVGARLVVVLDGGMPMRGLELIVQGTRGVETGQIHELIGTIEDGTGPGSVVNRINYLGFIEIGNGGLLCEGDELHVDGRLVGYLAGFDYTHMPNHMNIVIRVAAPHSGLERGFELGQTVQFKLASAPV